jgi:dTDP-4-amino-4,6-dideoxygalactose transaminase
MPSYPLLSEILQFEQQLGRFTGAPFVVMTDCCTHAIELCMRYDKVSYTAFTPFTYLSIPMTMRKLGIHYEYEDIGQWVGEYRFMTTRIWDSARLLSTGMYRAGMMQCLSFGFDKPLNIGHGGAILLDDEVAYKALIRMRGDGRDFAISPWQEQKVFEVGYHYRPTIEDALHGQINLLTVDQEPKYKQYPDLREIIIK